MVASIAAQLHSTSLGIEGNSITAPVSPACQEALDMKSSDVKPLNMAKAADLNTIDIDLANVDKIGSCYCKWHTRSH
jgi:hypothetical protein